MIKNADWVIDMGPGPGIHGGQVIAEGPPERVAAHAESRTAEFLRAALARHGVAPSAAPAPKPRKRAAAGAA